MKAMAVSIGERDLVNIDPSDLKFLTNTSESLTFSIGRGRKPIAAVSEALKAGGKAKANAAFLQIEAGPNLLTNECRDAVEKVAVRLPHDGKMIWGAKINKKMGKNTKVLLVLGKKKSTYKTRKERNKMKRR